MRRQCELLGIARSGLYRSPAAADDNDLVLMRRIDELFTTWPFLGSRRMTALLRAEGHAVNRKRIRRLMREMGTTGSSLLAVAGCRYRAGSCNAEQLALPADRYRDVAAGTRYTRISCASTGTSTQPRCSFACLQESKAESYSISPNACTSDRLDMAGKRRPTKDQRRFAYIYRSSGSQGTGVSQFSGELTRLD